MFNREYDEGLEKWAEQKESWVDLTADVKSFLCITGPMRAMTVNAVSTLRSRFYSTLRHTKVHGRRLDNTVATISSLCSQGFTGLQLAHATTRRGDRLVQDASDLLQHLTFGSPKLQ